jgi:hypothetical protein
MSGPPTPYHGTPLDWIGTVGCDRLGHSSQNALTLNEATQRIRRSVERPPNKAPEPEP